jgi:putative ABC transport system substrate-binding protein
MSDGKMLDDEVLSFDVAQVGKASPEKSEMWALRARTANLQPAEIVAPALSALPMRAQHSGKVLRIGFFGVSLNAPPPKAHYQGFLAQLRAQGFSDGENIIVEHQAFDEPRGPAAAELIRSQPDLIVALGPEIALQAVLSASGFIPLVMIAVNFDPLARGYIQSLARPGGNITGVVFLQLELAQKQVELLVQAFPGLTRLGVFFDAQTSTSSVPPNAPRRSWACRLKS